MKKYFSKPLEVESETQEYIQGGKVIINLLCMRYGEEFVIIIRQRGKKRKKKVKGSEWVGARERPAGDKREPLSTVLPPAPNSQIKR